MEISDLDRMDATAAAMLTQAQERFQAFLHNSPAIAFMKNTRGQYLYINAVCERLFAITLEEIRGTTDDDWFSPEVARQNRDNDRAVLESGRPLEVVEIIPTPDGTPHFWQVAKFPFRDADGAMCVGGMAIDITARIASEYARLSDGEILEYEQRIRDASGAWRWQWNRERVFQRRADGAPCQFLGTARDITDRKQAEEALRRSEALFRAMNDASPLGIFVTDTDGNCTYTNPVYQRITGLTLAETLGQGWERAIHPEDRERVFASWQDTAQNEKPYEIELRYRRPGGEVVLARVKAAAMRDGDRLLGYIGAVEDITERRQAENALRESQKFIQGIAGASPNILYLYDLVERRTIYSNRDIGTLLGYSPEELRDMGDAQLPTLMHPDDAGEVQAHFERFLNAPDGAVFEVDYRMQRRDGSWRWISSRDAVFARAEDGTPVQIVGSAQDVTESRWFEEQVQQQITLVNEANVQMQLQQAELATANARLQALATTDGLTGLNNHRAFQEKAQMEFERARRYHTPLSLLLLDVDHFKQLNDAFGHPAGDHVLKRVAEALQTAARATDFAARYGGEEFVVILPEAGGEGALAVAERLRQAVESLAGLCRPVTASFGVATLTPAVARAADLIEQADKALYASKRRGRNRVTHFHDLAAAAPPPHEAPRANPSGGEPAGDATAEKRNASLHATQ